MPHRTRREQTLYLAARVLARLPDALKVRLSGEPAVVIDGQVLDPQLQLIRSVTRGRKLPGLVEPTISAGRGRYRRQTDVFRGPPTAVAAVRDLEIPTAAGPLRAREYLPPHTGDSDSAPTLTVYFHGGGFVIGDLDTHDEPCRMLCRHASTRVLSVAYRLAPEHPFPAAVEDARAAFAFALEYAAPSCRERVAVAGDSAGGNLGAVLAAVTAGTRQPIAQLLIYPATDFDSGRRSHELFGTGFFLTRADVDQFRDAYVGRAGVALDDPRLSPLCAPSFAGLPPTLVAVAGFDPLRDDVEAYAEAVRAAGVPVRVLRFPSLGHGFIHMTGVAPAARRAVRTIAGEWRAVVDTAVRRRTAHEGPRP